jgi:hypothetical protein
MSQKNPRPNADDRRANDPDPATTTFLIVAILFSAVIMLTVVGILIWQLGWKFLGVLGAAFVLFVVGSLLRDAIHYARLRQYRTTLLKK